MTDVREVALLLGPRKSMVGIATPAVGVPADAESLTAVILNSGIVHRVGANRMSVALARALATRGIGAVRFDLSGIGDSEPRTDELAPLQASLADIREALDSLQASGRVTRVVLIGLCSGADQSMLYSPEDPRVFGAVLIDPSIPSTRRFWVRYYRRRATNREDWRSLAWAPMSRWRSMARRIVGDQLAQGARGGSEEATPGPRRVQDEPEARAFLNLAYRRVLAAGVHLLTITTGERSYPEQLLHAFPDVPFNEQLRLEHFEDADHVFSALTIRDRAIETIVDWVQQLQSSYQSSVQAPRGSMEQAG